MFVFKAAVVGAGTTAVPATSSTSIKGSGAIAPCACMTPWDTRAIEIVTSG